MTHYKLLEADKAKKMHNAIHVSDISILKKLKEKKLKEKQDDRS